MDRYAPKLSRTQSHPSKMTDDTFDHHRFDNYTAWIDLQERAERKSRSVFFHEESKDKIYGFSNEPAVITVVDPVKKPFKVTENSFTSGEVVTRQYDENAAVSDGKFEVIRSDPFHFPNVVATTKTDHWGDYRSGSRDPFIIKPQLVRPLDKELRDAVPDSAVKQLVHMKAMGGKVNRPVDRACADILFAAKTEVAPTRNYEKPTAVEGIDWTSFTPNRVPFPPLPKASAPPCRGKIRVTASSVEDDRKWHLRCKGGIDAHRGLAGTWSSTNHGVGVSEFTYTPQPLMNFW